MQQVIWRLHALKEVAWVIIYNCDWTSCDCSFGNKKFVGQRTLEKLYGSKPSLRHHCLALTGQLVV